MHYVLFLSQPFIAIPQASNEGFFKCAKSKAYGKEWEKVPFLNVTFTTFVSPRLTQPLTASSLGGKSRSCPLSLPPQGSEDALITLQ